MKLPKIAKDAVKWALWVMVFKVYHTTFGKMWQGLQKFPYSLSSNTVFIITYTKMGKLVKKESSGTHFTFNPSPSRHLTWSPII